MFRKSYYLTLFCLLLLLAACAQAEPKGYNLPPELLVTVDEIEPLILESFPVQVNVLVRGWLANACVVVDGLSAERNDTTFDITIEASTDGDFCGQALVWFERPVALDVAGLPAGTYEIRARDISAEFTLDIDNISIETPTKENTTITLERTGCYGTCPVYTVTLYGDGTVNFDGENFVAMSGSFSANVGPEAVANLVDTLRTEGYFDLENSYTDEEVSDASFANTLVKLADGTIKRIEHYNADSSAPEILGMLEQLIDETANTNRWIDGPLAGIDWTLQSIDGSPLLPNTAITLKMSNLAGGFDGCNHHGGPYELGDDTIMFKTEYFDTTTIGCEPPILEQSGRYFEMLSTASGYALSDGMLTIEAEMGVLVFGEAVSAEVTLTGTLWTLSYTLVGGDAIVQTPVDTDVYFTLENNIARGKLACNGFSSAVTIDGNTISFETVGIEQMDCGDERSEREAGMLELLPQVTSFALDGQTLSLFNVDGLLLAEFIATAN